MAKALKVRRNLGVSKYPLFARSHCDQIDSSMSGDNGYTAIEEEEEISLNGFSSIVGNSLKLEIPFLSRMTDPSPTPVRHTSCCEFNEVFKEMTSKKEICDRHNEGVYVPDGNMTTLKRILIVDDSMLCRKIIIKVLDGANYSFETACNGKEACDKIGVSFSKLEVVSLNFFSLLSLLSFYLFLLKSFLFSI